MFLNINEWKMKSYSVIIITIVKMRVCMYVSELLKM